MGQAGADIDIHLESCQKMKRRDYAVDEQAGKEEQWL
jgi:hypothetical protein